jgi:hypothetical protein
MPTALPCSDAWDIPPMDHEPGHKESAFTWAMGMLILRRMGARETMKQITADPRMPAYCTVFQWVRMHPEFAEAYRTVRTAVAQAQRAEMQEKRARLAEARDAARVAAGKRVRHWVSGPKSTYTAEMAEAVLEAVRWGASLSEVVATPGMPSFKAIYGWMKRRPEFAAQYAEACDWRAGWLAQHIEAIAEESTPATFAVARRRVAALEGRIGRLTPKLYR